MIEQRELLLSKLGFRFGINGPHAARTMMLDDLRLLLSRTPTYAIREDYKAAVVDGNVLGKPTRKARELAFRHLATLYGLEVGNPIFRALRRLWPLNETAQPLLALTVALARDPLLAATRTFILAQAPGAIVSRESIEKFIAERDQSRFSAESLKAFAQRIGGTWTAAGYLRGKVRKMRVVPEAHPESVALLLFLGYLEGRTGQRLFSSEWLNLFGNTTDELEALASSASHRGLLVFLNAGGVKEVRFPDYLTPEEENVRQEVSHVV